MMVIGFDGRYHHPIFGGGFIASSSVLSRISAIIYSQGRQEYICTGVKILIWKMFLAQAVGDFGAVFVARP
jgi:hypothetical protein